ncbi:hypothetical protein CONLIGDRAFT_714399 [Coniochaeta ligniaria NRRL 30616]|uniref:DNA (cytosine-5)-methyltransferase 1 replication foci domain-containing protein n=1 Tax=Coniochaeta ligniaria NRRL 30616 TaxID=1408157 RepID=A0A1J7JJE3_9PEZI|nr:hypothetical protein CONLIGDRAFT_714399 [Coniochaeta ligniaria NRRL 30616]
MAGHRRNVSNSTVATVDSSRTRWRPETDFLKPLPEKMLSNSDEWPCFVLTDATVYLKDGKRPANPLLPDGPFVVRGRLEVDGKEKEQRKCLVNPDVNSGYIEIQGATMYSISYGPLAVWVGGGCGWFELVSPAPQFEEIYDQMREAVTLYYEILTVFESLEAELEEYRATEKNKKKRMRKPTVNLDEVLLQYAVAVGDGMFRHEAEERCHKWAPFLINQFPKEGQFEWQGTFFYTWIIDKHPDIYKKHLKRAATEEKLKRAAASKPLPPVQDQESVSRANSVRPQSRTARSRNQSLDTDVNMKDVSSASPPVLPRPLPSKVSKSPIGTPQSLPAKIAQATPQALEHPSPAGLNQNTPTIGVLSPVEVLIEAVEEIAANNNGPIDKIARSTVGSRLYYGHRISNYNASSEILAYYSKDLVRKLDNKWHASPFWQWLLQESKKPSIELLHTNVEKIPYQLVRRQKKQTATPTATPRLEIRPKARQPSDDEDLDSDDDASASRVRHAGKGGLRLQSASKKRKAAELLDDDTAAGRRGRKSAKTSHYFSDPEDEDAADNNSSTSDVASAAEADDEDPDSLLLAPPKDAVRVVVHAEKLPSISPSGPNGTWVCDQEDCGYVVRAAEEAAGKRLVQQHFRDHEAQTQKMSLALTEAERRGRMPINHLLEKLQRMGKDSLFKEREVINGEEVPLPIKRRLVV